MYPAAFEYLEPQSLQEAVDFLARLGEDARILAGGQSLIPLMKLRLARPKYLIDLNRVAGLSYVEEREGCLMIGALTTHADIESSPLVCEKIPMMREAVSLLGDLQVRNLGTAGGAIVEADPAGDWGPVILALNARLRCLGPRGEREIKATDFYTFAYTTVLETDELVREIVVPIPSRPTLGRYIKLERVAGDFRGGERGGASGYRQRQGLSRHRHRSGRRGRMSRKSGGGRDHAARPKAVARDHRARRRTNSRNRQPDQRSERVLRI